MNCFVSGIIGLSFLGASVSTMLVSKDQMDVLRNKLSPELALKYDAIARERATHYIQGLVLGMGISYIVLQNLRISNQFHKLSVFFAITLCTAVIYYFLMPKSDYMLNHLKSGEQTKAWLEIYKTMKARYFIGFVLGAISAVPIGNSLC